MSVSKPAYSQSIVHVNAGEVIPETLLRKLCSEYGSCVGLVVREPNKIEVEKFLELGDDEARYTLLSKINNNTKKFARQFVFGAFPAEFDEDECQPWIPVKDSKGNPLLTVSCEGDFTGRTSAEGFSEAYVLMHEYLGPKLEDVYKLSGNNPQKLFDYLASASFLKDLQNTYGFRAAFGFMPTMGEPLMLGNFREEGKGGAAYSWGSASFNYGYTEAAVEAATVAPKEATMPKNPTKSKYEDDTSPAEPKPGEVKPSVPQIIPTKKDDPVERVAEKIVEESSVKWSPPTAIKGKGLKKAYRDMLGYLPEDWQQRPSFMIKAKDTVSSLKDLDQTKAKEPKDMRNDVPKTVLPVIDGVQQGKAVDFIKKYLGDGSAAIGDPLEAQRQESTLAVFSELCLRTGSLDELERWPIAGFFAFVKQNPEVAALAMIEYRRDRTNRKTSVKDGDKTLGELTGTDTAPAATPPKTPLPTETQPAMPELPAPRRAAGGSKYT